MACPVSQKALQAAGTNVLAGREEPAIVSLKCTGTDPWLDGSLLCMPARQRPAAPVSMSWGSACIAYEFMSLLTHILHTSAASKLHMPA